MFSLFSVANISVPFVCFRLGLNMKNYSYIWLLVLCISLMLSSSTKARLHNHSKHKHHHNHKVSYISQPPSPPPNYNNDWNFSPYPSPSHTSGDVFDVRNFGAVGDGETDDTQSFKMAWDTACQSESAVIHVPNGFSFMIQSTIFTGPCQGSLVFQVMCACLLGFILGQFLIKGTY